MKLLQFFLVIILCHGLATGQDRNLPIIDMHLHGGYKGGYFAAEQDGTPFKRYCFPEPCFRTPAQVRNAADIMPMTLKELDKNNIVLGFLSDQPPVIDQWEKASPSRFVYGFFYNDTTEIDIKTLRKHFEIGPFQLLGELAFQYQGVPINHPKLDPLFALASELDVPVLIHIEGLGPPGGFALEMGNPLMLNEVLQKYPNLRLILENAAWPFLEEVTAIMFAYPNVYADLSTITWMFPTETFHTYMQGLIKNGLSKRLMFGSDTMMWPEAISIAVEAIESAEFLTVEQRRDIFYNNAVRFLRLSKEQIAKHHEN